MSDAAERDGSSEARDGTADDEDVDGKKVRCALRDPAELAAR